VAAEPFAREGDSWTLRVPAPALDRFEYALAVQRADGSQERWTDPSNPLRAPGAFGEKSVVELPGYAAPSWLGADPAPGAFDALESGFVRYRRIVRFVRATLREPPRRAVPVAMTCGALEENAADNRVMARALAAQGYPVSLHEGRDLHNYTAWRDAWVPHLT